MKFIMVLLCTALSTVLYGQYVEKENNESDTSKTSYLDEIVISANRFPQPRKTIAQQLKLLGSGTITNLNVQNTAELISNSGVVSLQKSQQGGGSPVLRGFEANRVLLVIDGVRMNNAIYRAGHLQNIITTDNNILDRVEILFGPSSTVYGSDALGGVIHFYTRNPELSENDNLLLKGNAFFRYGSVNAEKTGHVDISLGKKKFGSITSFTFSDFGDLKMGEKTNPSYGKQFGVRNQYVIRAADNQSDLLVNNKDPFIQKFSGYRQYDVIQKFLFNQSQRVKHTVNFQFSNSTNIPRYDRLTDVGGSGLKYAQWNYGPQKRLMSSYQLSISDVGTLADALTTIISYQNIEESRHDRRFNNNNRNNRFEKLDVWGLTLDLQKKMGINTIQYGIDGQFNSLSSTASQTDVITGERNVLSTRYPNGDNSMSFLAFYITNINELSSNFTLNYGARIGGSWLYSTFINNGSFAALPFSNAHQNNLVSCANMGIIYHPNKAWKISLVGSTGYRAPNIDDLSKIFDSSSGSVIVPNKNLGPEKTVNIDFSVLKHFSNEITLETTVFATQFTNAIIVDDFTFNGKDSIVYDGALSKVLANQNKGKAYLLGYSATLRGNFTKELIFAASLNYTHGRIKTDTTDSPLDHIPPIFGRISLQYNKNKFHVEAFSNFNGWKRINDYYLGGEDNEQYATPKGMPSWYTINLRLSYDVTSRIKLQAGVDNLFDLQYRTFASGINAPGRNISGTIRISI